jgi:phosphoribosylformylglycinamidine cyclo-ligase
MVVVVAPDQVDAVTEGLTAAGETVHCIGRIDHGPRGCTVRGPDESWSAKGAWSATHHHG